MTGTSVRRGFSTVIAAYGVLAFAAIGTAHHSTTMFDMQKTVELKGTIKEFQWTNPHTWTIVTVEGDAITAGEYGLEGMSPNYLSRNGWTKRSLKFGDKVTLLVHPLKDGRKGGFLVSVTLADGTVLHDLPQREGVDPATVR
jgi:hypothetical protein